MIFFQIVVIISCQSKILKGRSLHTATLVGTKIYFLGGTNTGDETQGLNDFFYLDISKNIDKTKEPLKFVDLSKKSLGLPLHSDAATVVFGENKDSIFLFGGSVDDPLAKLAFSFSTTTQLDWDIINFSKNSIVPDRVSTMGAVIDNHKIYIFSGSSRTKAVGALDFTYTYSTTMDIFDTISKSWTIYESGLPGRDGHTSTFLPDTEEIIYIGGTDGITLADMTNLVSYNTRNNEWSKVATKNSPESRYGHTAVLTNDKRIVIFGGAEATIEIPVDNQYVVLDTNTWKWYSGNLDQSTRAPFRHHTATLYDDYMFIAFGFIFGSKEPFSNDVLIYKIGDYANVTEVPTFMLTQSTSVTTSTSTTPITPITPTTLTTLMTSTPINRGVIIGATIGGIAGLIIVTLGIIGYIKKDSLLGVKGVKSIPTSGESRA